MEKSFGEKAIYYYQNIHKPEVPENVEVLYPFNDPEVNRVMRLFYQTYFNDEYERVFLIGINPGRFGGGSTGIPFTDPARLSEELDIKHSITGASELSSRFIYTMIDFLGGPDIFYKKFYFTSVSPLGFTSKGKNLNYYDSRELQESLEPYMVHNLRQQIAMGSANIAFSLGMGKNINYLTYLNQKYSLFNEIRPLPHPRWIMQYRLKRLEGFLQMYKNALLGV